MRLCYLTNYTSVIVYGYENSTSLAHWSDDNVRYVPHIAISDGLANTKTRWQLQQRSYYYYCNKINFCVLGTSHEQSTWRHIKKKVPRDRHVEPPCKRSGRGVVFVVENDSPLARPQNAQLFPTVVRIASDPVKTSPEHFFPSRFQKSFLKNKKKKQKTVHHHNTTTTDTAAGKTHDFVLWVNICRNHPHARTHFTTTMQ